MLAFQAGDRGAFEALFRRYTAPLVAFLARMVPDRGRAEELAQEVFLRSVLSGDGERDQESGEGQRELQRAREDHRWVSEVVLGGCLYPRARSRGPADSRLGLFALLSPRASAAYAGRR